MAVHLLSAIERLVDKGAGKFVQEVVQTERALAPVESGYLAGSISGQKISLGHYIISTNAVGRNGFAYPAHIEKGEGVTATTKPYLTFIINGRYIRKKSVAPSSKSGFARKTISKYGGTYTG